MNKSDFTIFTLCQDLMVDSTQVFATNDALNSFLYIPVKFKFRQPSLETHYDIDTITANLYTNNTFIASTTEYTRFSIDMRSKKEEKDESQTFKFRITNPAINFIEKHRDGDAKFRIEFRGILKVKTLFNFKKNGGIVEMKSLFDQMELRSDMYIDIPQSQWVKKILHDLNYNSFLLIEVPLNHKYIKEAFSGIKSEFVKAEKYFKDHQYYECVGACRKTMDKLKENLLNFKEGIGSKSKYKWLTEINEHTRNWIESISRSNSSITSKPHHAGDHNFLRQEAESVYLVTLGLMNYIGNIKN